MKLIIHYKNRTLKVLFLVYKESAFKSDQIKSDTNVIWYHDKKNKAKTLNFKLFHSRTTVRTFHFGSVFLFNKF